MRLTVIGSADASNSGGRAHSCYWLDGVGTAGLMVDFGGTALMQLRRLGKSTADLGTIAFTHLHGDHIGGFPYFFVDALHPVVGAPRTAPLTVIGPIGCKERLHEYLRVAYGELAERPRAFEITWIEIEPGASTRADGCLIEGFPAAHMSPPEKPLCLRITADGGGTVAFSGDTAMCDGLRDAARGADLLVAECTGLEPPAGKHTTWVDWIAELPTIGARRVLLTHLGAQVREAVDRLLAEAPEGAELAFADDGLILEV